MSCSDAVDGKEAVQSQPNYAAILDGWLAEWYEATVLGRGKPSDTLRRFGIISSIQPQLMQQAVKLLGELQDIPAERCFITKTKREFLRKVTTP